MRVLVVEDQKQTALFVRKALQAEGHAVDVLHDGDAALAAISNTPFDVMVLDIMLPGRDGLSVVKQMRERKIPTPVLLLTARGHVGEKVEGLNAGADDYLSKPFALDELVARVRALGRRNSESKSTILRVGDLSLDTVSHQATRNGRAIELTRRVRRCIGRESSSLVPMPARCHVWRGRWCIVRHWRGRQFSFHQFCHVCRFWPKRMFYNPTLG